MNLKQRDNCVALAAAVIAITQPQIDRKHNVSVANIEIMHTLAIGLLKSLGEDYEPFKTE